MVLVGGEGVVENGGVINKLGTYQIALCAKAINKPFYVAAESYKFARLYPLNQMVGGSGGPSEGIGLRYRAAAQALAGRPCWQLALACASSASSRLSHALHALPGRARGAQSERMHTRTRIRSRPAPPLHPPTLKPLSPPCNPTRPPPRTCRWSTSPWTWAPCCRAAWPSTTPAATTRRRSTYRCS